MQNKSITKYILDIDSLIEEIEKLQEFVSNRFDYFESNFIAIRTAERLLEIIGEATAQVLKIDDSINISNTRQIIGLRNKIVHAYDSVSPSILWGIIVKDIPVLKKEIEALKST